MFELYHQTARAGRVLAGPHALVSAAGHGSALAIASSKGSAEVNERQWEGSRKGSERVKERQWEDKARRWKVKERRWKDQGKARKRVK